MRSPLIESHIDDGATILDAEIGLPLNKDIILRTRDWKPATANKLPQETINLFLIPPLFWTINKLLPQFCLNIPYLGGIVRVCFSWLFS